MLIRISLFVTLFFVIHLTYPGIFMIVLVVYVHYVFVLFSGWVYLSASAREDLFKYIF